MEYEETQMQWNAFDHIWGKACHDSEKYKGKKKKQPLHLTLLTDFPMRYESA